ncbi:MAG: PAS domain S-box protein, partial [Pseudomonadota bacterium]
MRISTKLILAQAVTVAIAMAAMAPTYFKLNDIERQNRALVTSSIPIVNALDDLGVAAFRIVGSTSEFGLINTVARMGEGSAGIAASGEAQEAAEAEEIAEAVDDFRAALTRYETLLAQTQGTIPENAKALRACADELIAISGALTTLFETNAAPAPILDAKEAFEDAERAFLQEIGAHLDAHVASLETGSGTLLESVEGARLEFMALISLAVLCAIVGSVLASSSITRPIRRLTAAAQRIAHGDLSYTPSRRGPDELAVLDAAFGRMSQNISHLLDTNQAAVDAAEASRARFRDVAEASSDWIFETDSALQLTFLSERFTEMTGLAREHALGAPLESVITFCRVSEDDETALLDVSNQHPFRDVRFSCTGEGGRLRYGRLSGRPMTGEDGTFLGYRGTARDVTREVKAEERVQH